MKAFKHVLAILSIFSLLFLAACGPKDDDGSKESTGEKVEKNNKEYDLLVWEDIEKSDGIKDAVEKFEKEHDVTVKVVEKAYAKQIEDLRLDGPAGTGPDVFTAAGDQIGTAVTEGLLKELSISEDIQSIYTDEAMASQIVDGKVYGLPKAVETTILYYNKALISEEDLPESLDEWFEYGKNLEDKDSYGLLALWDQIYYAQSVMGGYGGYIFGRDANGVYDPSDIGLNNDQVIEAAEYMQKFYTEGLFPAGIIGEQGINVLDALFTDGKAAAIISGPWNLEPFTKAGIDYGVKALPKLPNGENMSAFIGVKSYNVSSLSKNAELAQQFVEFIANEENSKVRYEVTKEVPAVKALAEDPVVKESEAAAAVAEQSQYSELTPNIPEMNEVWDPIDAALQIIATGKADPKSTLDEAVKTIDGQIKANHSN